MKHYLFEDMESREEFIVCACDLEEAKGIAKDTLNKGIGIMDNEALKLKL